MSYLNVTHAAEDPEFNKRIQACLYKVAGDVLAESPDDPESEARIAMATNIRRYLSFDTARFAWMAASNPTIAASIDVDSVTGKVTVGAQDGDIEWVVTQGWTQVAVEAYTPPVAPSA